MDRKLIQVDAEMLDLVLSHFTPDEVRSAEEEYDLDTDDMEPNDIMEALENSGDPTHILYPLMYLRAQMDMQKD